jgi:hypothetical protein
VFFIVFFISWLDAQEPWDPLDEDGEEESPEDTVSLNTLVLLIANNTHHQVFDD